MLQCPGDGGEDPSWTTDALYLEFFEQGNLFPQGYWARRCKPEPAGSHSPPIGKNSAENESSREKSRAEKSQS
jgi:hypothetical protein